MGQILCRIDETGVNQIFVKAYNALNQSVFLASELETQYNHDFGPAKVELKFKTRLVVPDLAVNATPINLIGGGQTPPARYGGMPVTLMNRLEFRVWPDHLKMLQANAEFEVAVTVAGGASVSVSLESNESGSDVYRARLELDGGDSSVSFEGNRLAFMQAIQPAINALPQPLRAAATAAANNLFSQASSVAASKATDALRKFADSRRLQLGQDIARRWTVRMPGGDPVQFVITNLGVTISGNALSLTAAFS